MPAALALNTLSSAANLPPPLTAGTDPALPVGVFDSGVGGLSILRHISTLLPHEKLLYFADSDYAPYGEKPEAQIVARSFAIAQFLLAQGAKALVVACNTATVASIKMLRAHYPQLPLVGVEPGLKPAASLSQAKLVGVLATERTLSGSKFLQLEQQISSTSGVRFVLQAATGLADLVEKGELDSPATRKLLDGWLTHLLAQGIDTLVLGCTHYPFVRPLIEQLLQEKGASHLQLIDTGDAVARQLQRVLQAQALLRNHPVADLPLQCFTSGSETAMQLALERLLQRQAPVQVIHLPHQI